MIEGSYDGAIENLTFVGATPQKYNFDDSTSSGDPGANFIRFDNSTFAGITEIYASTTNFFNVQIPNWLDRLDDGARGRLTIQQRNSSNFAVFDVTGVSGSGSWRTIDVVPVQASSSGVFADNVQIFLSFVGEGGSPQGYVFSTSTGSDPDDKTIRFDDSTFANITEIFTDDLSVSNFDIGDWLDSLAGPDARVTVQKMSDSSVTRIFKVNGITNSTGYRTISVTPIHAAGTLNDGDPVVLISSKASPIRDRVGALVKQVSEEGWPSGHMLFRNCTFLEGIDGVQLDDPTTATNNCADNTFIQCNFFGCDAGIKANHEQVVNNTVINCDFSGCTVAIDHEHGGDLRVFGSSMNGYAGDVFLKVRQGGHNASSYVLYGVRLEMKAGRPSLLETVDTNEFDTINVLIDGFGWVGPFYPDVQGDDQRYPVGSQVRVGNTIYESIFDTDLDPNTDHYPPISPKYWRWLGDWVRPLRLSQNTNCTIRGSIVKGPFADVTGDTARATLRLDNCRLSYNASDVVTTGTSGIWKTIDCTDGQGLPLDDAGNWSVNDFVRLNGRSGGQKIIGGTAASNNLTLESTSHAAKGSIVLTDNVATSGQLWMAGGPITFGSSQDVALSRSTAGVLEINSGTAGQRRDLLARDATFSGKLRGATLCVDDQVENLLNPTPTTRWIGFRDSSGNLLGYVNLYETGDGS